MLKVPGQVWVGCNPEPRGGDGHFPPALQSERRGAGRGSCRYRHAAVWTGLVRDSALIISVFLMK